MSEHQKMPEEQFPPPYSPREEKLFKQAVEKKNADEREKLEQDLKRKLIEDWPKIVEELSRDPSLVAGYEKFAKEAAASDQDPNKESAVDSSGPEHWIRQEPRLVHLFFIGFLWVLEEFRLEVAYKVRTLQDERLFTRLMEVVYDFCDQLAARQWLIKDPVLHAKNIERVTSAARKVGIPEHLLNFGQIVELGRQAVIKGWGGSRFSSF